MKTLIIAAGVLALGAGTVSAQPYPGWRRDWHPYPQRYHSVCQDKAFRLHNFERRAASDGRISYNERQTIFSLKRDLDRTCGRYRWRG